MLRGIRFAVSQGYLQVVPLQPGCQLSFCNKMGHWWGLIWASRMVLIFQSWGQVRIESPWPWFPAPSSGKQGKLEGDFSLKEELKLCSYFWVSGLVFAWPSCKENQERKRQCPQEAFMGPGDRETLSEKPSSCDLELKPAGGIVLRVWI